MTDEAQVTDALERANTKTVHRVKMADAIIRALTPYVSVTKAGKASLRVLEAIEQTATPLVERLNEVECELSTANALNRCIGEQLDHVNRQLRIAEASIAAMREAALVDADRLEQAISDALKPYRHHVRPGENAHLWLARRCVDDVIAAIAQPLVVEE